jgi:agmatinase
MDDHMSDLQKTFTQILCPPGDGVYTVNTAKDKKESLQKKIYGEEAVKDGEVKKHWENSLKHHLAHKTTGLIGITSDCGGGILRGANWGPLFIREALYEMVDLPKFCDFGDIRTIPHLLHDKYLNTQTISSCRKALYQDENAEYPVSPLSITERFCDDFYATNPDRSLLAFGGDHSVSYPLVKPFLKAQKKAGKKAGLIHFDAHTDLLKERLGIDLCFGTWTAHVLEYLDSPSLVHQIGIRSSGRDRNHWENSFNLHQHWTYEVKQMGAGALAKKIVANLKDQGVEVLYLSFDIDALDSLYASSTGTPEDQGLTPAECLEMIDVIAKEIPIQSADIVEVAPFLQTTENFGRDREMTIDSAKVIAYRLLEILEHR